MGGADVSAGVRVLQEAHVPHYTLPEHACRAMGDVRQIRNWRARRVEQEVEDLSYDAARARGVIDSAPDGFMREDHCLEVLRAYGLPVPPFKRCTTAAEAVEFAARVGYPVALRIVSRDIVHKTEVGGVALDCGCADAVLHAWDRIRHSVAQAAPDARVDGLLVRHMIPRGGTELICGAKRDVTFGPVVMIGLGGIYVELFGDVAFAPAPLSIAEAGELLRRTRASRLLEGLRGTPAADIALVERCLVRLSRLVADFPRIAELDVNPLIALPDRHGVAVADVRLRLAEPSIPTTTTVGGSR
jgi:acyl-CoA synthetase (NDP forming)